VNTEQILYIAGAGAVAGGMAFTLSRLVIREGVRQKIAGSSAYAKARLIADGLALTGFDVGLPSADDLARALVPVFSTASPYEAGQDIMQYGRKSKFWPEAYRSSDIPYTLEMALIGVVLVAMDIQDQQQVEAA
jgi:hypothetical protein